MKNSGILAVIICAAIATSCKKDSSNNPSTTVGFVNGGLSSFSVSNIVYSGDTTTFYFSAFLSASANASVNLSIDVDDAARLTYNAQNTSLQYAPLPDSCFTIPSKTATVQKSGLSTLFSISFYKQKINPAVSYMLPVTITDGGGLTISDSLKTIYFHVNGNFLSDSYTDAGTKTEYSGSSISDSISYIVPCPTTKILSAIAPNISVVDYADLGAEGWQYVVTVDSVTNAVSIAPNKVMIQSIPTEFGSPTIIVDAATYDPINHIFHFKTEYTNFDGKLRIVDETLTKQ